MAVKILVPLSIFLFLFVGSATAQKIEQKKDVFGITFQDKWIVKAKYSSIVALDDSHPKVKCYALKEEGKWDLLFLNAGEEFGVKAKDLEFPYDSLYLITQGVAVGKVGELSGFLQINNWRADPNSPSRKILAPECAEVSLWKERMPSFVGGENEPIWFNLKGKEGIVMNVAGAALPNFRMVLTGADSIVQFGEELNPLMVYMNGKIGLLDLVKKQDYLFPPKYEQIEALSFSDFENVLPERNHYFKAKEHGMWGLTFITSSGEKTVLESDYDEISQMDGSHLFKVIKAGKAGVIGLRHKDGEVETLINSGYDELLASSSGGKGLEKEMFFSLKFDGKYGFGKLSTGAKDKFELISIPKFEELTDIDFEAGEEGYVTFDYKQDGKWGYVIYFNNGSKKEVQAEYDNIFFVHHQDVAMHFSEKSGRVQFNPHDDYTRLYVKNYHKCFSEGMLELNLAVPMLNEIGQVLVIYDDRKHQEQILEDYSLEIKGDLFKVDRLILPDVWDKLRLNLSESFVIIEETKIPAAKLFERFMDGLKITGNKVSGSTNSGKVRYFEILAENKKVMEVEYTYLPDGKLAQVHQGHMVKRYSYGENGFSIEYYEPASEVKKDIRQEFTYDTLGNYGSISYWLNDISGRKSVFSYSEDGLLTSYQEYLLDPQKKKFMGNGIYDFIFAGDTLKAYVHTDNQAKLEGVEYNNLPSKLMTIEYDNEGTAYGVKVAILPDSIPDPEGAYIEIQSGPEGSFEKAIIYSVEDEMLNELKDMEAMKFLPAMKLFAPIERIN